jgi:hypothetical protein
MMLQVVAAGARVGVHYFSTQQRKDYPWCPTGNAIVVSILRIVMEEKQTTTFHPDQLKRS